MPIIVTTKGKLLSPYAERQLGHVVRTVYGPLGKTLVDSLKARAPEDRGNFKKSIKMRLTGQGLKTTLTIFANSKDAQWAEEGRKPGKAPPLRPTGKTITRGKNKGKPQMESILVDWLKRRGFGATASERRGIAYKMGQKIAREGTKGWHGFANLKTDHASEINAAITQLGSKIAELLNS